MQLERMHLTTVFYRNTFASPALLAPAASMRRMYSGKLTNCSIVGWNTGTLYTKYTIQNIKQTRDVKCKWQISQFWGLSTSTVQLVHHPHQSPYWSTVLSHLLSASSVCLACVTVDVFFSEHCTWCMATTALLQPCQHHKCNNYLSAIISTYITAWCTANRLLAVLDFIHLCKLQAFRQRIKFSHTDHCR